MCFICRLSSSLTCCFTSADPLQFVTAAGRVQKLAVGKALSSAFQKILLVVLGKTWRGAARMPTQELLDVFSLDFTSGVF